MKRLLLLASFLTFAALSGRAQISASALPGKPETVAEIKVDDISNVLARAGKEEFKLDDIRPYLAKLDDTEKATLASDPATLNKFVRTFVIQRLLMKEAIASGWDKKPDNVVQLERLRENAIADGYLASVSEAPAGFPSDAELKAAYEANKAAFLAPRKIRLAQIFVSVPKNASKDAVDKAQSKLAAIEKDLKAPDADFFKLAAAKSDESTTAMHGGEVGWVSETQIHPEIRAQALTLKKGEVSAPIHLEIGWVILKALDVNEAHTLSLAEVQVPLIRRMRAVKAQKASEAYVAKLTEKNPMAINQTAMVKMLGKPAN